MKYREGSLTNKRIFQHPPSFVRFSGFVAMVQVDVDPFKIVVRLWEQVHQPSWMSDD